MGAFLSILLGFAPMFLFAALVYWVDRFEKEPKFLLGTVFVWGAVVAAGAAFLVNSSLGLGIYLFTGSERASDISTSTLIAPIVEESLKGLAVLLVFAFFRWEFDSLLDGIVYAGVAALGFAATENAYYIFQYGFQESGYSGIAWMTFVRVILVGWQHPFYTAFIGIGLATARLSLHSIVRILAPLLGWMTATFLHAAHNFLAYALSGIEGLILGTSLDWAGWILMLIFIAWAVRREGSWITHHLQEEVQAGRLTLAQYRTACSPWRQGLARFGALFSGRYLATATFYQTCAELAYKKQQLNTLGEENGASSQIEWLRLRLSALSSQAAEQ